MSEDKYFLKTLMERQYGLLVKCETTKLEKNPNRYRCEVSFHPSFRSHSQNKATTSTYPKREVVYIVEDSNPSRAEKKAIQLALNDAW